VARLGLRVRKVRETGTDPVRAVLGDLASRPADLIVLATHQRDGVARWLHRAVAEPIARRAGVMTLFVPPGARGFVDPADGTVRLTRVLFPVVEDPAPRLAAEALALLAGTLAGPPLHLTLLHVGAAGTMPAVALPDGGGAAPWTAERVLRAGDVVEGILDAAVPADLVVMATQGHRGFLDALRGSTTERVVRGARCPVLAVPAA
jgi:nucleotide-binding universal stress UspA family protein